MDYSEFVAVAAAPKEPEMKDFERMAVFAHSADKEHLWQAMGTAGIHSIYRNLIANALQRRLVEELELEQTRKRKLEETERLEAAKKEEEPRRRLR